MQAQEPRAQTEASPISVYEVHAGSWMRLEQEGNRSLDWTELADRLIPYVQAWASPTSSFCRSRNIRSEAHGVISRSAFSRPPVATGRRRTLRNS